GGGGSQRGPGWRRRSPHPRTRRGYGVPSSSPAASSSTPACRRWWPCASSSEPRVLGVTGEERNGAPPAGAGTPALWSRRVEDRRPPSHPLVPPLVPFRILAADDPPPPARL